MVQGPGLIVWDAGKWLGVHFLVMGSGLCLSCSIP